MFIKISRFCALFCLSLVSVGFAQAFDVVSGGGKALIDQSNFDNASKELLTQLLLTTNTSVSSETVTITIPAGVSNLAFSTDPVAITSTSGNFTVSNLNQSASQIDFNITGNGTLSVANIGLYTTNPLTPANEDRTLTVNFQASNNSSDFFHVDTNTLAVGFGGGQQLNSSHGGSGSALAIDDLTLVASAALTDEVVTITFDPATAFTTPAAGSITLTPSVDSTTVLDSLDDFATADTINVTDGGAIDSDFVIGALDTADDLNIFFNSITGLGSSFNNSTDAFDLTADTTDFTISSDGAMPSFFIGPGTSPTGSISASNTTLSSTETLASLDQFADGDTLTATDSSSTDTSFAVTATNTVQDLTNFIDNLANLSASWDDASNEIDIVASEDYTISSDGAMPDQTFNFGEAAALAFVPSLPNFVVTSGSLTVASPTISTNQIQFLLSGTGELELQGLQIYATNLAEKGEFFETRFLNVNALATDLSAETFVVDTNDYGSQVALSGASGGPDGTIFIIGDTINFSFAPFDYSTRFSASALDLSAFGGTVLANFDDPFSVVADDDDGAFTVPLTLDYTGTNVSATYNSLNINLDNQAPSYDFTGHNMLVLPEGKTVGGINDLLTLSFPAETSGDTITFTADFSDVAGTIANFIDQPAVDTQIALQEVAIDTATYAQNITFADDAGNTLGPFNTNQVSVDLIRPVLATANVLSIVGAPVPGAIGDIVDVALPVDTAGGGGDTITYDLDLSAIGSPNANLSGAEAAFSFPITAGTLNDAAFNQTLTVYDKALNSVSATTNSLQIDNAVPTFDTSCGATFQVNNKGDADTNSTADLTNGEADTIFFLLPDKTKPGCDLDRFSVNLSAISATPAGVMFENAEADGTGRIFTLAPGNYDNVNLQFPLRVFDVNGNQTDFLTGGLNLDNRLATANQITDDSAIISGTTPNGAVLEGGVLNVYTKIAEYDITSVIAEIPGAALPTPLTRNNNGRWLGTLNIVPGLLEFAPKFITYHLTDDAGNVVSLKGDQVFYITNDTREQAGGGGGSLNFSNISKKSTLQRFTPSQSKEFHNKNAAIKQKSKAQLRLESLKNRMTFPSGPPSRIVAKPESLVEQQREGWRARQAAIAKDGQPKKLQSALERLAVPKEDPEDLAAARDDAGEFRLRSTLDRLKTVSQKVLKPAPSRRKIAPGHRGKWLEIKH